MTNIFSKSSIFKRKSISQQDAPDQDVQAQLEDARNAGQENGDNRAGATPELKDRRAFLQQTGASVGLAGMSQSMPAGLAQGLVVASTGGALAAPASKAATLPPVLLGSPEPFSFDMLKARAAQKIKEPYTPPEKPAPEIVAKLTYEEWGKISYKTARALFVNNTGRFPVSFFHLGKFFQKAVTMNLVDKGVARKIIYDPSYFDMPATSPAHDLQKGAGFAGFKIHEAIDGKLYDWHKNDWVAFLGAAYFRAIGELHQYGLSARAVALDTAVATKDEEFPDFTEVYFEETPDGDAVTLYAMMEGPSIVSAVKFILSRGKGVVMDITQEMFLRAPIVRFGLAPLTSMYWFSETKKQTAVDWRPEVHDSDGLAMWTGWGEHLWRPLNNPPRTMASAFGDENPKGFGLLQRDRNFDHYQDGVNYDRRPSLWVEPLGSLDGKDGGKGWGKGAIHLVEIPTDDEIHDNIVAMWVPQEPAGAGTHLSFAYRLHWLADEPYPTPLARVMATRLGNGGQPGLPRPKGVRKFIVEFWGGPLETLPFGVKPEVRVSASRGTFSYVFAEAVPDGVAGHWRAWFDLTVEGADPVEMRCTLEAQGKPLTETWLYQYHPF